MLFPGLGSLVELYSAVAGINLVTVVAVGGAMVAATVGQLYSGRY